MILIVIIILILVIFYYIEGFDIIRPTLETIPYLDKRCQDAYGKDAFYDIGTGKCYSCGGFDRNPGISITRGGCTNSGTTGAVIIDASTKTCLSQYGNNAHVSGTDCYTCDKKYPEFDVPFGGKPRCGNTTAEHLDSAFVSDRIGVALEGKTKCRDDEFITESQCLSCPSGWYAKKGDSSCSRCTAPDTKKIQDCTAEFKNKSTTDIWGNPVSCGDVVVNNVRERGGKQRYCWCCPPGYKRNALAPIYGEAPCVKGSDKVKAYRLRYSNADGTPIIPQGWTKRGNFMYKCPVNTNTVEGESWNSSKKCCKYHDYNRRQRLTCSEEFPATDKYQESQWDSKTGKCWACPKGYSKKANRSITDTYPCSKAESTEWVRANFQRPGIGKNSVENIGNYVPRDNILWNCPENYNPLVFLAYDNPDKCIRRGTTKSGVLLGELPN